MKEYKLELPDRLEEKSEEVTKYLLVSHYEDEVFTAGACAFLLGIDKYDFQTKILDEFGIEYP